MVAMQSPLVDLQYDDQTGRYIAALERQVMGLTINEVKYQALLELITGEEWTSIKHDLDEGKIRKIAVEALEAKGIGSTEARRIVREREATNITVAETMKQ